MGTEQGTFGSADSACLRIDRLSAGYSNGSMATAIFRFVSATVARGEVLGLFGPNGGGKSTFLRSIAGLIPSDSGSVSFPDWDGAGRRIAMVPQSYRYSFFDWLDLMNNVRITLPSPWRRWSASRTHILDTMAKLDLDLDLSLRPAACSGGMLQQAALIRAFASPWNVLLADEPFSALDVTVAARVRAAFVRLVKRRGLIAVVVLHSLQDIVELCDRVLVIPGVPFSTEPIEGFMLAPILENANERAHGLVAPSPFVAIAERLLARRPA